MTSPSRGQGAFRTDIQALRAAAVGAVVLFHLWPHVWRGGYVGVDVFFVISGYLITSHLVGEIDRHSTVRLLAFWGRRLRRLMPAALTVLAASTLAVFAFIPRGQWEIHLREIIASALYSENWLLAHDSVDYLAAENVPSVVQHYWSLAVEEQFYLVWPLLLLGALAVLPRRTTRRTVGWALAAVFVASLAASVVVTRLDPGPAYFVTYARAWEFAAGGLLAVGMATAPAQRSAQASFLRWAGWAAIGATVALYTQQTPFPGWTALLPVLGTVLVIAGGEGATGTPYRAITGFRPIQEVGTLSYGIYLWHWPLIIVGAAISPHFAGFVVLAATCLLAWATYRWIENPIRFHRRLTSSIPLTYLSAATACALVVVLGISGLHSVDQAVAASAHHTKQVLKHHPRCLGAQATLGAQQPCTNPRLDGILVPNPAARLTDTGGAYSCYTDATTIETPVTSCHFGPTRRSALRVALVGNSHAATLLPGLKPELDRLDWSLDTYVARNCRWMTGTSDGERCRDDQPSMKKLEDGTYDLILVTQKRDDTGPSSASEAESAAMASAFRKAIAKGSTVVAIADNPELPDSVATCVDNSSTLQDLDSCTMTRTQAWAHYDPLPRAVELAGQGAGLVDLSRAFCIGDTCPVVIGHVLAYRDHHHMTATFVRTLAPFLITEIRKVAAAARS
ncbi:acyltransferase family protein [Nocardioides jiangxiensis]|uniref:Acyltransferase family protein n=1 Tax=Nocardioides jiangxiensis TaxID=3064524 RepID=A0ABT9B7R4_9ACTN|nr:acyltransferase family protein [Nocardioides sp. WY-20]MDO7869178.1 acyltransferase family protein [Nocardioides sp. WY-20]